MEKDIAFEDLLLWERNIKGSGVKISADDKGVRFYCDDYVTGTYPLIYKQIDIMPGDSVHFAYEVYNQREIQKGAGSYSSVSYFDGQGKRICFDTGKWMGSFPMGIWSESVLISIAPADAVTAQISLIFHGEGDVLCRNSVIKILKSRPDLSSKITLVTQDVPSVENFLGCGAQGDFFLFNRLNKSKGVTDDDIQKVAGHLKDMRLRVARMFFDYKWWEPKQGKRSYDNDDIINFIKTVKLYKSCGIQVNVCPWGDTFAHAPWQIEDGIRAPRADMVEASVESLSSLLKHLIVDLGLDNVRYVTLLNEPDCWHELYDIERYKNGIKALDKIMRQDGIRHLVGIIGSDDSAPPISGINPWFEFSVTDEMINCYDFVASHTYCHYFATMPLLRKWVSERISAVQTLTDKKLPFLIGEFGHGFQPGENETYEYGLFCAAFAIVAMCSGTAMLSFWNLIDTYYTEELYSRWGMIRYKEYGFEPKPVFYAWSLLTKYFNMGDFIYPMTVQDAWDVCGAVSYSNQNDTLSIALVNYGDIDREITIENLPIKEKALKAYVYKEDSLPESGMQIASGETLYIHDSRLFIELKANTFVMLA